MPAPTNSERGYERSAPVIRRDGRGHEQNAYRVRCECGYPLYLSGLGISRRTCTSCRRSWNIRFIYADQPAVMTLSGIRTSRRTVSRPRRSAAAQTQTAAIARLFPELSTEGRAFGVELELIGDRSRMQTAITGSGIPAAVEGYNHSLRDHWKIVTDASVYGGSEVVSPKLSGEQGFAQLYKVCEATTNGGATINASCGLHVHLDAREMSEQSYCRFFAAYALFEEAINGFMPRSRHNNQYAHPINSALRGQTFSTRAACRNLLSSHAGRYWTVNPRSFAVHGTIEVRHHSGTTEWGKISNWVKLLLSMMDAATAMKALPATGTLTDLLEWSGCTADVASFFKMRTSHFAADGARRSA